MSKLKAVHDEITASEAIYGFCGWLTTREQQTVMSSSDECSIIVDLITKYCKSQNLIEPRADYDKYLKSVSSN